MIRPLTCICMLAAAVSGLYLYQTKHRAQMLDREIARTLKQIDLTRDRITALKSERAQLSDPDRLKDLAATHLPLKTLAPTQFVALADLGARLPPPAVPGSLLLSEDQVPTPPPAAVVASRPPARSPAAVVADRVVVDRAAAEKPVERPVQVAALPQPQMPSAPAAPAAAPAAASSFALPPMVPAVRPPAPRAAPAAAAALPPAPATPAHVPPPAPHFMAPVMAVGVSAIQPQPAPGSIGESVARAARAREAARHREPAPVFVSATPQAMQPVATQVATVAQPLPYAGAGSALGSAGRVALPPPVPFAAGAR